MVKLRYVLCFKRFKNKNNTSEEVEKISPSAGWRFLGLS